MTSKEAIRVLEDNRPSVIFGDEDAQKRMVELCQAIDMAIEALKADAVSREECDKCKTDKEGVLLQQLAELHGDYETMKNAYEDALAEAEWIPCSERLPSDDEHVIVSALDDHGDTPWKYTTVAWLCSGVWISDNDILCGTAVAWMPLPTPYKGGDAE